MDIQWWHLPGPARFVQAIVQDLRAGKNVVLAFPAHAPDGFREALADRVRDNELWRWKTISADEFPSDGVAGLTAALHERFVSTPNASELCSAVTLAQRLVGTVVWVEDAAGKPWPAWSRFLDQYQHACQSCDPCERSMFCVPVTGNAIPVPQADVALSVRRWEGMVGRLDMMLYLDRVLFSRFPVRLHYKVAVAVVTELAGSDMHLARELANRDLAAIMEPFAILNEFAAARGWTSMPKCKEAWHDGTMDKVDGITMVHSAAAVALGKRSEVARRVWKGQIASLYPFIEEQRVKIIPQVRGYIRLPVETTYGTVGNAEDLELGQLVYFLRGKKIQPRLWRLLNLLTDMRHALAHLEPVPVRSLLADEIVHIDR